MRRLALAVGVCGACSFTPGTLSVDGQPVDPTGDARIDVPDDVPPGCSAWSVMPTGLDPCTSIASTSAIDLCSGGPYTYSTTDGALTGATAPASTLLTSAEPDLRVVALTALRLCANVELRIVGTHPVAFLVHGDVDVAGTIDASAWLDNTTWTPGPGGELACMSGTGPMGTGSTDGAGGGGGGGYGDMGGAGGPGDVVAGVMGGMPEADATLSPLRGGCAGGPGGNGDNSGGEGAAGRGGGAIQIAARGQMAISGSIRANGGPGAGGTTSDSGGGGGGGGGAILLEAAVVATSGALCANGGGGGGGASDGGGFNPGGPGGAAMCAESPAGGGGAGSGGGSAGGKGGFGSTPAEPGKSGAEGGGGGGGAVGRIRVRAASTPTLGGVITPPAM